MGGYSRELVTAAAVVTGSYSSRAGALAVRPWWERRERLVGWAAGNNGTVELTTNSSANSSSSSDGDGDHCRQGRSFAGEWLISSSGASGGDCSSSSSSSELRGPRTGSCRNNSSRSGGNQQSRRVGCSVVVEAAGGVVDAEATVRVEDGNARAASREQSGVQRRQQRLEC